MYRAPLTDLLPVNVPIAPPIYHCSFFEVSYILKSFLWSSS